MKHLLTFLAVLSFLVCLFFVVLTIATINSSWEVQFGKTDPRTRSAGGHYGELVYNDAVTADLFRRDLKKTTKEFLGFVVHKEMRYGRETGEVEATSYQYALSPAYPITLFAMPALAWVVVRAGGRKQKPAGRSDESEESAGTSPKRP